MIFVNATVNVIKIYFKIYTLNCSRLGIGGATNSMRRDYVTTPAVGVDVIGGVFIFDEIVFWTAWTSP